MTITNNFQGSTDAAAPAYPKSFPAFRGGALFIFMRRNCGLI